MTSPASAIVILLLSEASYPAPSDNLFYLHIEEMANIQAKAAHDLAVLTASGQISTSFPKLLVDRDQQTQLAGLLSDTKSAGFLAAVLLHLGSQPILDADPSSTDTKNLADQARTALAALSAETATAPALATNHDAGSHPPPGQAGGAHGAAGGADPVTKFNNGGSITSIDKDAGEECADDKSTTLAGDQSLFGSSVDDAAGTARWMNLIPNVTIRKEEWLLLAPFGQQVANILRMHLAACRSCFLHLDHTKADLKLGDAEALLRSIPWPVHSTDQEGSKKSSFKAVVAKEVVVSPDMSLASKHYKATAEATKKNTGLTSSQTEDREVIVKLGLPLAQAACNTADALSTASRDWQTFKQMVEDGYNLADDEVYQALGDQDKIWYVCFDVARVALVDAQTTQDRAALLCHYQLTLDGERQLQKHVNVQPQPSAELDKIFRRKPQFDYLASVPEASVDNLKMNEHEAMVTSLVAAMQVSRGATPKSSPPQKKGDKKPSNKRKHEQAPSTPKGVGEASDAPYQPRSTYQGSAWKPQAERGELSSRAAKTSEGSGSPKTKMSPPAKKNFGSSASPASKQ